MEFHASSSYPNECCGVIVGKEDEAMDIWGFNNDSDGPKEKRYLIGPEQILEAERRSSERGLLILGIYHSHPDVPAEPSKFDLDHAWPWYRYVILSVKNRKIDQIRAWILDENRSSFNSEEIKTA